MGVYLGLSSFIVGCYALVVGDSGLGTLFLLAGLSLFLWGARTRP